MEVTVTPDPSTRLRTGLIRGPTALSHGAAEKKAGSRVKPGMTDKKWQITTIFRRSLILWLDLGAAIPLCGWSLLWQCRAMLSDELGDLIEIIILLLRTDQGVRRAITPATQICYQLGVCDDDMDDVMLEAIRRVGRRPLMAGEPGSEEVVFDPELTVEGLASFILTRCPPIAPT
ncbi:hypothetical protein M529_16340 [Sphingobium ummariense RL-3]|uniref:Uncharacterized protein n=1 Tax=Sphingobium ummariense RL-3 TaxID=1346791 RepID=T0IZF7_9SPHN|nr:hypothetical protein M529_16340 [Sphingobium ummariense RL-3]